MFEFKHKIYKSLLGEKEDKMIKVSVSRCEMENNEVNSSVVLLELVNE